MQIVDSHRLVRRFIELAPEKRRLFLDGLRAEGVDFPVLPIPSCEGLADRDTASYAQRRMWFLWQLDPQSAAYNLPMAVHLRGKLDRDALQSAFDALLERHEALRTVFRQSADGSPKPVPCSQPVLIQWEKLAHVVSKERMRRARKEAELHALRPFNLEAGPLLHVKVLQFSRQEHVLLLCLHHICADGWSLNVLIDEFSRLYDAYALGETPQLPKLSIQYRDYALWQRCWLEAGEMERQLAYWQERLHGDTPDLELPLDRPRPALPVQRGARCSFNLDPLLLPRLRALANAHDATLFMVLLAAFKILLFRYTGQTDIAVGVPVANRGRVEIEPLIGCFINTQVLRTSLNPRSSTVELIGQVRDIALGAQSHQDLPFERLVETLRIERSAGRNPLFQVMFNHQSGVADIHQLQSRSGLLLSEIDWDHGTTQFD
ncbi:MAG TPA: condensation domain-containing protein, partial [Steroidobacter sp.]|nr:condensation domain-containing protein [Steroidobacter sp.]